MVGTSNLFTNQKRSGIRVLKSGQNGFTVLFLQGHLSTKVASFYWFAIWDWVFDYKWKWVKFGCEKTKSLHPLGDTNNSGYPEDPVDQPPTR